MILPVLWEVVMPSVCCFHGKTDTLHQPNTMDNEVHMNQTSIQHYSSNSFNYLLFWEHIGTFHEHTPSVPIAIEMACKMLLVSGWLVTDIFPSHCSAVCTVSVVASTKLSANDSRPPALLQKVLSHLLVVGIFTVVKSVPIIRMFTIKQ